LTWEERRGGDAILKEFRVDTEKDLDVINTVEKRLRARVIIEEER
jgi:hypothetical protein